MRDPLELAPSRPDDSEDLTPVLPLYAASLVVTLAGIGAVGVTITSAGWTPIWALLAIVGHAVSLMLRRMRVSAETIFYPVMLLGADGVADDGEQGPDRRPPGA